MVLDLLNLLKFLTKKKRLPGKNPWESILNKRSLSFILYYWRGLKRCVQPSYRFKIQPSSKRRKQMNYLKLRLSNTPSDGIVEVLPDGRILKYTVDSNGICQLYYVASKKFFETKEI